MSWKRAVVVLAAAQMLAAMAGRAQDVVAPQGSFAEFGRASGGEIQATIKQPSRFSGSLGLTTGRTSFLGSGKTYGASLGGTLLKDKAWFFGTAERSAGLAFDPALSQSVERGPATLGFGMMSAQLGDRQSVVASTIRGGSLLTTLPSSFLSLNYTGIVSSNMFFTARVSRQTSNQSRPGFLPGPTP